MSGLQTTDKCGTLLPAGGLAFNVTIRVTTSGGATFYVASEVVDNQNGTYRYPSSPLEAQLRGSVTDFNFRILPFPPEHSVSYYPTVSGTYTFYVADLAGSHLAGSPYAAGLFPPGINADIHFISLEIPQLTSTLLQVPPTHC